MTVGPVQPESSRRRRRHSGVQEEEVGEYPPQNPRGPGKRARRCNTAQAMAQLAAVVGCDPATPVSDLVKAAVEAIQSCKAADPTDEVEELRMRNQLLKMQVENLRLQMALGCSDHSWRYS